MGTFRTRSLGDSISVALRKLLQGSKEGESGYTQVFNKRSRQSKCQTSGIKLRNLAFYVWEDASLWSHWIHSFHMHPSYLGPILFSCSPCFLHSCSSSAITVGGGSICWITVLGAIIHIWRPEIADGCDISCLLIWQEIFLFHNPNVHLTVKWIICKYSFHGNL